MVRRLSRRSRIGSLELHVELVTQIGRKAPFIRGFIEPDSFIRWREFRWGRFSSSSTEAGCVCR